MLDAATARRMMVDGQIRTADITNPELTAAMLTVPRERFVPPGLADRAYMDGDIPLAPGRVLLKPIALAKLIQAATVAATDRVLDVACGTGYSSAVLAQLADSVTALEEDAALAGMARQALAATGAGKVTVVTGPLAQGWPAAAPYDVILLNGATEIVPEILGQQLKPSGRLVCIYGRMPAAKAMIYRPVEGHLVGRSIFETGAPVLPGFVKPPAFVF